jgi:methionine synthase II (cobalamin-independent)
MASGIDRTTLIEEITEKYPELIGPLREHGIVCIRCGEPIWGTLEEVAREKGIEDIDRLVTEMNRMISKSSA